MKLLSSVDAHLILLSASLLASVGATPLPLALGTDTTAVSRAAIDPSHLAVTSGRGLPENISPGLTSDRSSDLLTARDSTIPLTRRGNHVELALGNEMLPRPSLEALGNPIQALLTKELDDKRYNVQSPGDALRMLRLDLLFALAEETGFKAEGGTFLNPSLVTKLKKQLQTDLEAFSGSGSGSAATEYITRAEYLSAVLGHPNNVILTPAPQLPESVLLGKDRYRTFLGDEITKLKGEGDSETQDEKLILARRITELGLRYNLIREIDPKGDLRESRKAEIKTFDAGVRYFEELTVKEDAGSEAEMIKECKARAKYYKKMLPR